MKRKTLLTVLILFISFGLIAYGGFQIFMIEYRNHKTEVLQDTYAIPNEISASSQNNGQEYIDKFSTTKNINNDFIGWLSFDSGLVNTPIVQGSDNVYYMDHNFEQEEDTHGSPCLSSDQNLFTSPNLTIFGHYVYADTSLVFSPLSILMDQTNYVENQIFKLFLENEVRSYQIVSVIHYTTSQETLFAMSDFTPDQWDRYVQYINEYRLYDTGATAVSSDNFVVLQTCIRNARSDRLLVIGREISNDPIEVYFTQK